MHIRTALTGSSQTFSGEFDNRKFIRQVTNNTFDDYNPQISDDGSVVWYGFDGTDSEIYIYGGTPAAVSQITNNSTDVNEPRINWG